MKFLFLGESVICSLNRWHRRSYNCIIIVYTLKDISASQERLCHLLSKNYNSACAICWANIILHSHPEIEISFKFIPKILMSKECIHFFGPLCICIYIYICIKYRNVYFRVDFPEDGNYNFVQNMDTIKQHS